MSASAAEVPAHQPQTPPPLSRLIPITAFSAFHGNYTGIERTGEMKLSLVIPIADIPEAMKVGISARKEVLWVEVSKLEYDVKADEELMKKIAEQEKARRERDKGEVDGQGGIDHPELGFSDE